MTIQENGDPNTKPIVWAIVLHWQGSHYTRACIASLLGLKYKNCRILLVDNGSPDQSGPTMANQFPEISLLQLPENLGFAGGSNAGINYCLEQKAQWIWLLNNDTRVAANSLDLLINTALDPAYSKAGILGAMVYTGQGEEFVASGPGKIDFLKAKTFLRQKDLDGNKTVDCEWISGSNLLMRAEAIKELGGFDEDYFLYFEDTDLCLRMRKAGWKVLLVPKARVEHAGGGSTEGGRSYWRAYYYTRNRLLFFLRHLPGIKALPALVFIWAHLIRHALVLPFRGKNGKNQLRAEYLGARDYLLKQLGKAHCLDWCEEDV